MSGSIELALIIGAWAHLFAGVLTDAEGIFRKWPNLRTRIVTLGKYGAFDEWERHWIQDTLLKWMGECSICHSGIVTLISFLAIYDFDLYGLFKCLVVAMLTTEILDEKI